MTPWLQDGRGLTASAAGLLFLVMSGVAAVTSFMGTWGSRPYWALLIPALALLAGSLAMVVLDSATSILHIGCMMALFGIANGMAQVANQIIVYQVSPPHPSGCKRWHVPHCTVPRRHDRDWSDHCRFFRGRAPARH